MTKLDHWCCSCIASGPRQGPHVYVIACVASAELGVAVSADEMRAALRRCGFRTVRNRHTGAVHVVGGLVYPDGTSLWACAQDTP